MNAIVKKLALEYPAWTRKKQSQPRPPKHIRKANGRRPNCRAIPMQPEYAHIQLPEA